MNWKHVLILAIIFLSFMSFVQGDGMSDKKVITVAVGSKNPVKVNAAKSAFTQMFPEATVEVVGIDVSSDVSAQPMSDEESIRGARTRAQKAMQQAKTDFGVGIEGGLHKIGKTWFDTSWTAVCDVAGKEGIGSSGKILVPDVIMQHIHSGLELGQACDLVFNTSNVKQKEGFVGLMTNNVLNRTISSSQSVVAALAGFLHAADGPASEAKN